MKQVLVLTPEALPRQGSRHMARSSRIVRTLTVLAPRGTDPAGASGSGLLPAPTAPQPFLPVPASLTRPAGTVPCSAGSRIYPARWVTGAAREPGSSGHVLISYADYCVSSPD